MGYDWSPVGVAPAWGRNLISLGLSNYSDPPTTTEIDDRSGLNQMIAAAKLLGGPNALAADLSYLTTPYLITATALNALKDAVEELCTWADVGQSWSGYWPLADGAFIRQLHLDNLRSNLDLIETPTSPLQYTDEWGMSKSTNQAPRDGTLDWPPDAAIALGGTYEVQYGHWYDTDWTDAYERALAHRGYLRFVIPPLAPSTLSLALTIRRKNGPFGATWYDDGYYLRLYSIDDITAKPVDQDTRDALWAADRTLLYSGQDFTIAPDKETNYDIDIEIEDAVPGPIILMLAASTEEDGTPTYNGDQEHDAHAKMTTTNAQLEW